MAPTRAAAHRCGSHALGRAGPHALPPRPAQSPTRSSHHLPASSNPGNSSRPPRPTSSSSAPRVPHRCGRAWASDQGAHDMRGLVRSGRLAILILGLAGITGQGRRPGQDRSARRSRRARATSSPSREKTSTRCRSPASAWAGTPTTGRPATTPSPPGRSRSSLFRELTDNLYVFGQLTTSLSDEGDEEPTTEIEIDNLLVSFTPQGRVERQPHLRHARRPGRLRAGRRGAAAHADDLVQLRAGPAGQAHRPVRDLDPEPEGRSHRARGERLGLAARSQPRQDRRRPARRAAGRAREPRPERALRVGG